VQQYKGVPPYRETHAYVARVVRDYNRKKLAERKNQRNESAQKDVLAQSAPHSGAGSQ